MYIAIFQTILCSMFVITFAAYWIAQRAIKMVYDHVDGLQSSPHDITVVQDQMNSYFKVVYTYVQWLLKYCDTCESVCYSSTSIDNICGCGWSANGLCMYHLV